MPYHPDDTIAAIATAPGGAARGIVRLSGPRVVDCIAGSFRAAHDLSLQEIRLPSAISGNFAVHLVPGSNSLVPCDLFLWPGRRSYTRQPAAELHTLGSPPLLDAVLQTVCRQGARLAEPGEFTLRAFLAGRIDLTQAEAVLGVIDATDPSQLQTALSQLAGGIAQPLEDLRNDLLQLLAELEAGLDFVEEDIEFISGHELLERLDAARELVGNVHTQMSRRTAITSAFQVALVGPPNAGKSSLFNALVDRFGTVHANSTAAPVGAIVSPICGTTRDYLTAVLELDGVHCQLVDTAGVDIDVVPAADSFTSLQTAISGAAQTMAAQRTQQALVRIQCIEALQPNQHVGPGMTAGDVLVVTKADLLADDKAITDRLAWPGPLVITSSRTAQGLNDLGATLREALLQESTGESAGVIATTASRCHDSLQQADYSLNRALALVANGQGEELVAAEVREALYEIGRVVGAVYTDDILDRIFSSFCIGK